MGCGTSVPGRHLPAPRVASGCLLRASTPGKSLFTGCPLTHRRTNPVQAHSLRHAFLRACPHPPARFLPASPCPVRPSFGVLSLCFHVLHHHPFPDGCLCPPGSGQGKPAPTLHCRLKSPLFMQVLGTRFAQPGVSKHKHAFPSLVCSFLELPD